MTVSADTATPRVSQLAVSIQRALRDVDSGWVEGEVQRRKTVGGHTHFTLADENATIDWCVWRSRAARIRHWPADGQLVQVHFEKVDFYARCGSIAIHVDAIRVTGEAELLASKQATLDKLTVEGLVARAPRPLPRYRAAWALPPQATPTPSATSSRHCASAGRPCTSCIAPPWSRA
jgi:exonuclease VII large subunit